MIHMTSGELAASCGGRLLLGGGNLSITKICIDSRQPMEGALFVPIIGERVDAHRFICIAIKLGASAVFTSRHRTKEEVIRAIDEQAGEDESLKEKARNTAWIAVRDTRLALQTLGKSLRKCLKVPLVGVTGSVGKTTTREMVAAALSARFHVYRTPGNSNSQVGVPITLSKMPDEAEIGVIELGMSEPGEMSRIAQVACVNAAVFTNIGMAHIAQFGSKEAILAEKMHIRDGMAEEAPVFLNGDDALLRAFSRDNRGNFILYGFHEGCDWRGSDFKEDAEGITFTACHGPERIPVRLKVRGQHMALNALAALAVAASFGVSAEDAAAALSSFSGFKGRQDIFRAGFVTVIDDSYNASPDSMRAALKVLAGMEPAPGAERVAVLADMKELGSMEVDLHRQVGAFLAGKGIQTLVLLGTLARRIGEACLEADSAVKVVYCSSLEEVKEWLCAGVQDGSVVLFKGSNSMHLSSAVAYFRELKG